MRQSQSHQNDYACLADKLDALLVRLGCGNLRQGSLQRLTGGANKETWALEAVGSAGAVPLIMRRLSADALPSERTIEPDCEARLIRRAGECDVPTPRICHILEPGDGLGAGFFSGENRRGNACAPHSAKSRILQDTIKVELPMWHDTFARIHAIPVATLPQLKKQFARSELDELYQSYRSFSGGSPVFEAAFRWLRDRAPDEARMPRLVHGDFVATGNWTVDGREAASAPCSTGSSRISGIRPKISVRQRSTAEPPWNDRRASSGRFGSDRRMLKGRRCRRWRRTSTLTGYSVSAASSGSPRWGLDLPRDGVPGAGRSTHHGGAGDDRPAHTLKPNSIFWTSLLRKARNEASPADENRRASAAHFLRDDLLPSLSGGRAFNLRCRRRRH